MTKKIVDFLKSEFEIRSSKNSSYTLRAFAKGIGVDYTSLFRIIKGQRELKFESALKILSKMDIDLATKNSLLLTFSDINSYSEVDDLMMLEDMTDEATEKLYRWESTSICVLLNNPKFQSDYEKLCEVLNISLEILEEHLTLLIKYKMIEKKDDKFVPCITSQASNFKISPEGIVNTHKEFIDKANSFISHGNPSNSAFLGLTIPFSKDDIKEAQRRIDEFQASFIGWAVSRKSEKIDEAYRFNLQLFPLKGSYQTEELNSDQSNSPIKN